MSQLEKGIVIGDWAVFSFDENLDVDRWTELIDDIEKLEAKNASMNWPELETYGSEEILSEQFNSEGKLPIDDAGDEDKFQVF